MDRASLLEHRRWLAEHYAVKTANIRLTAINSWLDFNQSEIEHLSPFRMQQKPFLDNVITQEQYESMRDGLLRMGDTKWYFIIRFLAGTGARVSELLMFKAGNVRKGYLDIVSKGDKLRRVWVPQSLRVDALPWISSLDDEAFLFVDEMGNPMTARQLSYGLKRAARQFGVDEEVVYPHSFRHLFAKNFIARQPDIAFLADLMGHKSIETTRVYLRKTADEQRRELDAIVDW